MYLKRFRDLKLQIYWQIFKQYHNGTQMQKSGTKVKLIHNKNPDEKKILCRCSLKGYFVWFSRIFSLLHSAFKWYSCNTFSFSSKRVSSWCCWAGWLLCPASLLGLLLLPLFPELLLPGSLLFKMLTCSIGENEKECGQLFPLEMQRKWVTNSAPNSVQIHRALLKFILNDFCGKFVLYGIFFCLNSLTGSR